MGIVFWRTEENKTTGWLNRDLLFLHKSCYSERIYPAEREQNQFPLPSMDLEEFLAYLLNNTGMTPRRYKELIEEE
jgi:hypothetical protein